MKSRRLFHKFWIIFCFALLTSGSYAQRPASSIPREEKLLNGLKVLMWSDPSAQDVRVSIRVHSGSAFDPQGKEGLMQLLADNIFPNPTSKAFFTDDLGGGVEVITNYDYIQVNASAKPSEFVTLIETLAQAVSKPTIDKETTTALKNALAEKLILLEKDPDYVATQAVSRRLFGTFPYGRPQKGTIESLQRIDFADLNFVRERFLAADNATVTISGNFNSDLGFRAARRYFGAWLKSDKRVPSTFRQPDDPDPATLELHVDGATPRTSFALRGLARNDPDYAASVILEKILQSRLEKSQATVVSETFVLPGVLIVSVPGTGGFPLKALSDRIAEAEFANARGRANAEYAKSSLADQWLDADTYRTKPADDAKAFQTVTLADVQRVADRLAKNPIAAIAIKPAA